MKKFDLIIVGGGAAAFSAAIRANELEVKTAMINTGLPMGGTCVNVGCVPTKNLLEVSNYLYYAKNQPFSSLKFESTIFDFRSAIAEKDELIEELRRVNYRDVIEAQPFVTYFEGKGVFSGRNQLTVNGELFRADKFIIATGSTTRIIPFEGINKVRYLTHKQILSLETLPDSLLVIGAGPMGLEIGQMFAHFGSRVTVLEIAHQILPLVDPVVSAELRRCLEDEGIEIFTNARTLRLREEKNQKTAEVEIEGSIREFRADEILLTTGVVGNVNGLGLEEIGVKLEKGSFIKVNRAYRTSLDHIYSAGDVIGPPFLEAVAAKEGYLAASNLLEGKSNAIDYSVIPYAVFTSPQVAGVGMTEEEYMERYGTCYCRSLYMNKVPKALAVKDTRGVVKMVVHHETRKIVGVHIVAPLAAEMIHEAALAVKSGMTIEDLIDTVHVFPTFSEAIKLTAQSFTMDISKMSCCVV